MIFHFFEVLLFSTPSHKTFFFISISLVSTPQYFLDWPFFSAPPLFFLTFFFFRLCCCSVLGASTAQEQEGQGNHKVSFKTLCAAEQAPQLHQRSKQTPQGFCSPSPFFFFFLFFCVCFSLAGGEGPGKKTQTLYFQICWYFSPRSQAGGL